MKKLTDLNTQGRILIVKMYYYHHMNLEAVKNEYSVSYIDVELPTDEAILETVSLFESTGSVLISHHELSGEEKFYEDSKKSLDLDVKKEPQEITDNNDKVEEVFVIPEIPILLDESSQDEKEEDTEVVKRGRPRRDKTKKPESPHFCSECEITFESKVSLRKHRKTHHGREEFQCTKCLKYYKTNHYLNLHMKACMKNQGTKPKDFTCPEEGCGRILKSMSTLRKHRLTHSERRFICEICGSRFHQQRSLDIHNVVHTKIKNFQCDICAKKFTAKATLRTHIRYHTGERPYKCDFCDNAFVDRQTMIVHRRQHTGEQPYSCPYENCVRFFKQKQNLRSHLKHIHNVQGQPNAKRPCNYELESMSYLK